MTANDIAIVNSYNYHYDNQYSSHTPDDDHPIWNVCVYRIDKNQNQKINKYKNNTRPLVCASSEIVKDNAMSFVNMSHYLMAFAVISYD